MDNYYKKMMEKNIDRLVRRGALHGRRIVLFGASVFSKEVKSCLLKKGLAVDGIVDNDGRKIGKPYMGLRVQKPEDALASGVAALVVLIYSPDYYREMARQLTRMGYAENKDVYVLNRKTGESPRNMAYALLRIIRGLFAYRRLTKGAYGRRVVFVAPYTGTGDIYLAGLFFNEYLRRNEISDYVFTVVSGACEKVAEMFGIGNTVVVKPSVLGDDIINCRRFLRADWPVVVLNDGWLQEASRLLRGYRGLNFEKMFRYFVFGFDDGVPHALPPRKDYDAEIDALFEKHRLIKGKTAVLSPYSNTLFDLPDDVLEAIIAHCERRGLTVCTNCAGEERPVAGTKPVFFPLDRAVAFMDAAGFFVGVRSGLCDIISASSCKKIILYEKDSLFYKSSQYEYFSLVKMGLCDDAVEIEYRDDLRAECLHEIFGALA
jgi:hypothetical protein